MNKIKVVNNKIIPFDDSSILINDEEITFNSNGNYYIEYIDCTELNISYNVSDDVTVMLFELSDNNNLISNIKYNIGENASLIISKFYNNSNTEENVNIYLCKQNGDIKYSFSSISNSDDKYLFNIYHLDRHTSSNIFNRTVARNDSSNIFDINSFVDNGIKECYLNQQTKIIALGASNNKINPNMFIGEESTTASHSSVIGNVNSDDLFYLMSRGIDYTTSINLIIKGMILGNINPDMEFKERILGILEKVGGE